MLVVESAGITDVGMKRTGNEDSLFLDDEHRLYVVADGMGGHKAGEVASNLVVETMRDYMQRFDDQAEVEEMDDLDDTLSHEANRLISSIRLANLGVNQVSQTKASYQGMGSTVSAVSLTDDTLIAANVGDSPIYLVHNDSIETISVPHTVTAEQQAINPDAAKNLGKQFKHMLTRAMGIKETVEPDVCEIPFFNNDIVVISSDGLSDKVTPAEILAVVKNQKPEKACRSLVDMANQRGGDDNVTIIVLKIKKQVKNGITRRFSGLSGWISNLFK